MKDKLLKLKQTNKTLYYIVFPIVILLLIVGTIMEILSKSNSSQATNDLINIQKEDFDLSKEQENAKRKAQELIKKAKKHSQKAKELENENETVDENWYKND